MRAVIQPERSYDQTYSFLKASEGGMSQRDALKALRSYGLKCRPASSCYVGHTAVTVINASYSDHLKAEQLLFG